MRRFLHRRGRAEGEHGIMLVWFALMLTTLLGMAGFAVDFWRWSDEGSRMQKAADAAALAGAVYMENTPSTGYATATDILTKNGYKNAVNSTNVTMTPGARPNQLKVKVQRTVKNYFGAMVGAGNTTITKTATAEYLQSVAMGSPINQFGNDPENGVVGTTTYPYFWSNVAGPNTGKVQGEAILSNSCTGGGDNCGSTNTDYSADGYFFEVEVKSGAVGPLKVQAFDPAYVEVGGQCGNSENGSNLSGAAALTTAQIRNWPGGTVTPAIRYSPAAPSSTVKYCTGDQQYGVSSTPVWTNYTLRAPDQTPWDPSDNPIVSGCSIDFPGFNGDIAAQLQAGSIPTGAPAWFAQYFRQWYTLCTVSSPQVGSYFLQVQTNEKANGTAAPNGHGQNRFALRAGLNNSYTTSLATVHGDADMGIYANVQAVNVTFYLARVTPGLNGRSLLLYLYDIGDSSGTGTLKVLPPTDSNVGASFANCQYTAPPGNATGPPWGTYTNTATGCQITGVSSANYQGQWVEIKVPIPDNYTCNSADPLGCWTKIQFNFNQSVTDATTWTARINGTPVRIVE